ncbi:hypothetical protein GGH99_004133 [Coemansia sp. RSA 1285]|nr:hypothetical protein EV177_003247 [Coemansia sp. RSA 1804]KAJ2684172.1 hypothetical protein GGH99_004133 [Coemansia sp. RSA 1285]
MSSHLLGGQGTATAQTGTGDDEERPNLWETVLKEASSSKAVGTKNVLILGDSNSGKTGVVTHLFQASLRPQFGNGQDSLPPPTPTATSMSMGLSGGLNEPVADIDSIAISLSQHDLALSYSYMDVRDEENEELVARLGIYQLASDKTTDCELLKFVLDARSFPDSAAVIVLDWSKPWRFVKSLLRWLNVLNRVVDMVKEDAGGREITSQRGPGGWTLGKATVDECRERLERFLQEYSETSDSTAMAESAADTKRSATSSAETAGKGPSGAGSTSVAANVLLPLGKGVLENNLGIPLVVVCTKSDAMGVIERERGFKEEAFDYIQQILRTVCLRFGAALIYTSTHNPKTFSTLYHYLVHRLLTRPRTTAAAGADAEHMDIDEVPGEAAEQMGVANGNGNGTIGGRSRSGSSAVPEPAGGNAGVSPNKAGAATQPADTYPFRVRANVVDRDVVFVPAGWDSVAKIGFLREPFDVGAIQEAWNVDEERYRDIVNRAVNEAAASISADAAGNGGYRDEDVDMRTTVDSSNSLLLMFGETVAAPKQRSGADVDGGSAVAAVAVAAAGMANEVVVENEHVFFERLFVEQQEQMAIEGEEASDLGAGHQNDAYADSRLRMGGSSSNKLVSSLLRSVHNAESSLSTVSDVADAAGGNLSDDGGAGGDDVDRHDAAGNGMGAFSAQRLPPSGHPNPSASFHSRMNSTDSTGGSLGRSAGARVAHRQQLQSSQTVASSAAIDQSVPAAGSVRRQLTLSASSGTEKGSGGAQKDAGNTSEDLTSFFHNLLGRKGGAALSSTSSTGKSSPQQSARSLGGSQSRASSASNARDIQADLERLKAQVKRGKE